jgi:HlyD family secretion protein
MDSPRMDQQRRRRKRQIVIGMVAFALISISVVIARLKPAVPTVERNLLWVDTVKRGPMLRDVRGIGSLVPEDITWIAARTQGRVDRIVLRPGAEVHPDSIILVLSNPDVQQADFDARSQLRAAEAEVVNLKAQLESGLLAAESTAASAKADYEQSKLRAEVNEGLFKNGLVPELDLKLSRVTAAEAQLHNDIEQKRLAFTRDSMTPQLAVKRAEVERLRAQEQLRHDELEALNVRAGMDGVLQILPVEVGSQVGPGTNLARVADPRRLKAEVRVAETQAKDVQLGQNVSVDTRNGIIPGRVSRIDPSVQNGTVTVDVALDGELPPGARPDLSIDGTIELERLSDVLYVGRPAVGEDNSKIGLFKLSADGAYATRTQVKLGRSSVNKVEILGGLRAGDQVILSDASQWDKNDRIRLN